MSNLRLLDKFITNLLEEREYTAQNYTIGHHPNQYIRGRQKAKLQNRRSTVPIDYSEGAPSLPKIWSRDMTPVKILNRFSSYKAQGDQGEDIILELLRQRGFPNMRKANEAHSNYPVDLIDEENFVVVEVKAGMLDNTDKAQWWRLSYDGNPTAAEKAWLAKQDAATITEINKDKAANTVKRKYEEVAKIEAKYGKKFKVLTYGLILDNDNKVADIFKYDGLHRHIYWKDIKPENYVGTYNYVQTRF